MLFYKESHKSFLPTRAELGEKKKGERKSKGKGREDDSMLSLGRGNLHGEIESLSDARPVESRRLKWHSRKAV